MKKIILFSIFLLALNVFAKPTYFGAKSTEARLTFNAAIEIKTRTAITLRDLTSVNPPTKIDRIKQQVEYQLSFLIGHFQAATFLNHFRYPGVLSDQQSVRFTEVSRVKSGKQIISYKFTGKANFATGAFSRSNKISLPLRLPLNPDAIYSLGMVGGTNACTDPHYNSEEDFFYFWDPDKSDCPLQGNEKDVLRLTGTLRRISNTTSTYPEYDRLYLNPELNISVFLGYIDDYPSRSRERDEGYITYREVKRELLRQGYKITDQSERGLNHFVSFEKEIVNQLRKRQKVKVNLLLSDSSVETTDETFTYAFQEALLNAQIVSYDGHSGLGGALDIERFGINKLPSFYQIFFFNGCSSYPYFNGMYFDRKPGKKRNLEIITSGLPTLTSTSTSNMLAFLAPFLKGGLHSYQTILYSLERSNDPEDSYLMGVNGDEDNSFRP